MKRFTVILTVAAFAASALAGDKLGWPRFRGPNGSGIAEGQNPPVEFGPDKNVRWKTPAPSGLSSPIVAGDKLVITAFDEGKLCTIAYQRADGREAWRAEAPASKIEPFHKTESSPAASTCATDGERIVTYFGSCGVLCFDLSGKLLWRHALPTASIGGDFGSGVSPIIADGLVILVRDVLKEPSILALDLTNGTVKWQKPRSSNTSYCTPVVWETGEGKQVAAAGHARMVGYDLHTGAEKWFVNGLPSACCSSPVVADGTLYFAGWSPGGADDSENAMPTFDGLLKDLDKDADGALSKAEAEQFFGGVFDSQDNNKDGKVSREEWDVIVKFMAEGRNRAFALKAGAAGDASSSMIWEQTKGLPYVASGIIYHGQFLSVRDGGIVTAFDAKTGKEVYRERVGAPGPYYASPVAANGHVYLTSLNDGVVTVLKAGGEKPQVVAQNPALGERTAATPAIADDCIYIRTEKHLYAFGPAK